MSILYKNQNEMWIINFYVITFFPHIVSFCKQSDITDMYHHVQMPDRKTSFTTLTLLESSRSKSKLVLKSNRKSFNVTKPHSQPSSGLHDYLQPTRKTFKMPIILIDHIQEKERTFPRLNSCRHSLTVKQQM